jgi:hypothetical protein
MLRAVLCLALFFSACAVDRPGRQTCTTTVQPFSDAELCKQHTYCTRGPKMTCAEAHYRLTHCARVPNTADNHAWLDGGIDGAKRNGIPCEDTAAPACGKDAKQMTAAIASMPYSPPIRRKTVCQPG